MSEIIKSPRNGCGLHGALQTLEEIEGIVPIVHSNAGCSIQNYLAGRASGLGNGCISGEEVFSTDVQERHVIFGGASRLREQIKNTVKVANGDLYVVLGSCESGMVGDDIEAMVREAQTQGEKVVGCPTAGFRGDSHCGYEEVMTDLIKNLPLVIPAEQKKDGRLVNLFGILPGKDIYFKGELQELRRILEGIGLKANTFFESGYGFQELCQTQNAALSIVFSKWGEKPARLLEERYGIPCIILPSVPAGFHEVAEFVHLTANKLSLDRELVKEFLDREEQEFRYYFHKISEDFYEENAGKTAALVGDEAVLIRTARFLKEYLGAVIETAIVTDHFGKRKRSEDEIISELASYVYFTEDGAEIQRILQHSDAEFILGSSLEENTAKRNIPFLPVSYPVYGKVILNKSYVGIHGALTFIEDYLTRIKEANQSREETERLRFMAYRSSG